MPSHEEDIRLIPIIQQNITQQTTTHPNHILILCGDFNRDIALIGRQNEYITTPPQIEDIEWNTFVNNLHLTYIPTNSSYSRQGGQNYNQTSLIDGYYIKTTNNTLYTSTINHDHNLNSDHSPVTLHIPPNTLLARCMPQVEAKPPRILNPIPQTNIDKFKIEYFEENTLQINELTNMLRNDQITNDQWQSACAKLDHLIKNISDTIQNTCSAPPLPILTQRTTQQGGFLPRKLQKQWKNHLSTYHLTRKAIYLIKNSPNWPTHPIIDELKNHTQVDIPPPPNQEQNQQDWIKILAQIAKTANIQARKITSKYTKECIKKAISKYRQLYDLSPKKINKRVFKNQETPPLDCISDKHKNILTNPTDIANEIHNQQSISNRPTVPTCYYQPEHPPKCTCGVRQYPWHDLDGFVIDKRGDPQTPLHNYFDRLTYDICLKHLANNKTPGPDKIPNIILKNMPESFHELLYLFFTHCYKHKQIPTAWKISLTILLYKKGDPSQLSNHRPIALANTIYKFFTSTLTSILSAYGERHQILHDSQEGFRAERSTSRQLQLLIAALEDARLTNQDIYLLYIDFKNAFGSLDHARLLAIMKDLGYPEDAVTLVGNIYSNSNTIFTGEHFGTTKPIPIQRGTIQGDTLSPYLFLIFLEPLLRWLQRGKNGYTFGTSKITINTAAYADDLAAITNNLHSIQIQLNKLDKYCEWSGMDLGVPKCAVTGCPNKTKTKPEAFKTTIQTQNINYRDQPLPVLHQNEPYVYLGIQLVPSLKWKLQTHITLSKAIDQCKQLTTCPATIRQKISMVDTVIRAGIAYSFYAVPYSLPAIKKLDKKIIGIQKIICGLPKCTANIITQLPHNLFGLEAFSLKNAYLRCISEQLRNALNDPGRLGIIYKGLTQHILAKHGGAQDIPRIKYQDCIRSPTTRTLFLLKKEGGIHLKSIEQNFQLQMTELESEWRAQAIMEIPELTQQISLKLLHKLLAHNIQKNKTYIPPQWYKTNVTKRLSNLL